MVPKKVIESACGGLPFSDRLIEKSPVSTAVLSMKVRIESAEY